MLKCFSIDEDVSGFLFWPYSLGRSISTILAGRLTDKGYGLFICFLSSSLTALVSFSLFIPVLLNNFSHLEFLVFLLFLSGVGFGSSSISFSSISEQIGTKQGFSNKIDLKLNVFTWWNATYAIGHSLRAAVFGGLVLDAFGYYWTSFIMSTIFVTSQGITLFTFLKLNFLRN